ncbi:MAG: hypothetical protein IJW72_04550 [Alphaproteobacteria bacterium]|nr:hypothetical protein [Alphaproteobacteria bacterium]
MFNFKKIGGQMLVLLMTLLCALDVVEAKRTDMAPDGTRNPHEEVAATASAVDRNTCGGKCDANTQKCVDGKCVARQGANQKQSASAVSGCSSNQGIFSGLIETGSKVFNGLRDLIYVVAGFGIIGVAVGGFFGNLNWKWLGAIVISLVVIATTGELISAITGCENFTNAMITDTLK